MLHSAYASSTAALSSPRTPPSCSPYRTWTARSSAEPRSTRPRSSRSWRPRFDERRQGPMSATPAPSVCLIVLDGWGLAEPGPGNAVSLASTPVFDRLWDTFPHTALTACGAAVGLPEGQMGNSEVGHLNLGA